MTSDREQAPDTEHVAPSPAGETASAPGKQTLTSSMKGPEGKPLTKQEAFVQKYAASAAELEKEKGVPALFTLAQGAVESGWGGSAIGNNLFGIKANSGWSGKKQLVTTTEYFSDDKQGGKFPQVISITMVGPGKYKYIVKDYFRDYDSAAEGLADHCSFLITNNRYAPAFNTTTPQAFAQAVAAAGYATDRNYAGTLTSMIESVKSRWPKDVPMPAGDAKAITGGKPGGVEPAPAHAPAPNGTTPAQATAGTAPPATAPAGATARAGATAPAGATAGAAPMTEQAPDTEHVAPSPAGETASAPGKQTLTPSMKGPEGKPLTKQEAFVQKYAASAAELEKEKGVPALFTLAQGAVESGWGERDRQQPVRHQGQLGLERQEAARHDHRVLLR